MDAPFQFACKNPADIQLNLEQEPLSIMKRGHADAKSQRHVCQPPYLNLETNYKGFLIILMTIILYTRSGGILVLNRVQ